MTHTAILAHNTFMESIRDRILVAVLAFGAIFVASSVIVAPLTLGEEERVIRDLGLAAITLFSVLLIVMVGTSLVHREIERRTIETILTQPVKRSHFILGKFLGFYATVLISIVALSVIYLVVVELFAGGVSANLFLAMSLTALEALVVTSIALFFSSVASPLLSAVFTFFTFVAGHLAGDLKELASQSENPAVDAIAQAVYVVLPALHQFDVRNNVLSDVVVSTEQVVFCFAYAGLYSVAVLMLTIVAFGRRDFE